jgi:putative restriction endonuclease
MSNILLANITGNPYGWRDNNYINPKAGHHYAKKNTGGEALNFNFNKNRLTQIIC